MVNTGDWQLFSILHGRQDGLGMYEASQWQNLTGSPRQSGTDLKLIDSLVFYQMEFH